MSLIITCSFSIVSVILSFNRNLGVTVRTVTDVSDDTNAVSPLSRVATIVPGKVAYCATGLCWTSFVLLLLLL